ncbi:MAG TPA: hypothetical protein GXX58_00850 [Gelria sp.]|nr:hypothetical protein [Gelria sp.]
MVARKSAEVRFVKVTPPTVAVALVETIFPERCPLVAPTILITVPTPGSLIVVERVLLVPFIVFVGV